MKKQALSLSLLCLLGAVACKSKPAAPAETPQAVDSVEAPAAQEPVVEAPAGAASLLNTESPESILSAIEGDGQLYATFVTSMGEINCRLFEKETPITTANFVGLANGSKSFQVPNSEEIKRGNFYDGLVFHRVIPDFMIQGGCPLGQGIGGPGYNFADEIVEGLSHSKAGILSMANAGPGTNGSQFFITDAATPWLDGRHTVFGECENVDVVKAIANAPRGRADMPNEPITIEQVRISRR